MDNDDYIMEIERTLQKMANSRDRLRIALRDVIFDILEYERRNHLAPNPGKRFCWDSVERAVTELKE